MQVKKDEEGIFYLNYKFNFLPYINVMIVYIFFALINPYNRNFSSFFFK